MTLPTTIHPALPDKDVKNKHEPTSQCGRILKRLKQNGSVTNVELNGMGIFRYSARLRDLREDGWIIVSNHVKDGLWTFVFQGHRDEEVQS